VVSATSTAPREIINENVTFVAMSTPGARDSVLYFGGMNKLSRDKDVHDDVSAGVILWVGQYSVRGLFKAGKG
jgi:hypothetical protein